MFKFILGGIIGAVVVAISYSGKLDEANHKNENLRREKDSEKHRRQASEQKSAFYQNENQKLKEENFNLHKKTNTSQKSSSDTKTERCIKLQK